MRPDHVPAERVVDFDLYDHAAAVRVHELTDDLRERCPVAWTDRNEGHWVVSRYEDVRRVLGNAEEFSSSPVAIPRSREADERNRPIPVAYDPPAHTVYRDLIAPLFTPRRMRELEDEITKLVEELIDGFADRGHCEFVREFAQPLPSTVFLMLMGWPLDRAADFNHWSHEILTGKPGGTIEESAAVRAENFAKVYEYFDALIADRRAHPQDDFTTHLVNGSFGGERPLTDDELRRLLSLLMMGGLHTVQGTLAYAVVQFAGAPEQQTRLREDRGLATHAVEEILRREPPVWPGRRAARDVVIDDVLIKAEDMVLCVTAAANNDPLEFEHPDDVDLDRRGNRHLAFGVGIHRCIGSHLARIELRIAFEALHRRLPTYRLDPDRSPVRHLGPVNGIREVHLLF